MRVFSAAILKSAAVLGALMAAPLPVVAQAQTEPPTQHTQQQLELVVAGDKIIGMQVIGSDGKAIGAVKDVVVTADGQTQAAIVETESFLGLGGRLVAVPMNRLQIEGGKINADLTREQAADMPEHKQPAAK